MLGYQVGTDVNPHFSLRSIKVANKQIKYASMQKGVYHFSVYASRRRHTNTKNRENTLGLLPIWSGTHYKGVV